MLYQKTKLIHYNSRDAALNLPDVATEAHVDHKSKSKSQPISNTSALTSIRICTVTYVKAQHTNNASIVTHKYCVKKHN